ncbi:MAG: GYD domain-containing protein [Pseudolabrys sp.]
MIRLVTRGRFTRDYAKGLIAAPEDREPIVRKLVEGAGGRLVNFYFTTGDADFLLITETNEAESAIAALLAAAAGTISDVTTSRAWTGAEFKAVADKASKVASLYSPPGKK